MNNNIWLQILVMAAVTYLIRTLPLTLIRKPVKNKFLKSFLYYVPYATLAVMTFPAMIKATALPAAGLVAFAICLIITWRGSGLFPAAAVSCLVVFVIEKLL